MSALSIVVANAYAEAGRVDGALSALGRELVPDDEVVVVGAAGAVRPTPRVTVIAAPPSSTRGSMYALGLAASRHPLVAFTDTATEVLPGWRAAAAAAFEQGAAVVGGPVLPAATDSLLTAAGFAVEYGPHSTPPFTSASGDVAANNVAYRRDALDAVLRPGEDVWKAVVDARLRRRGQGPQVVEAMRVRSTKAYGWADLLGVRVAHGRLYAAQRSETWPAPHRLVAAVACVGLTPLAYCRLAARAGRAQGRRRAFLRATPLVFMALASWSVGEAAGYLLGPSLGSEVF